MSRMCIKVQKKNKKIKFKTIKDKIIMTNIINTLVESDIWKIQLTRAINFVSYKDTDEEHVMHSKSNNIGILKYYRADKVIEQLFEICLRYQIVLKTSMRGSNFIFNCINLLYYKCH